tara:strand:+ start:1421 stop:1948 length:528 start_codon:yes stop_codon:yes gene_type:complete
MQPSPDSPFDEEEWAALQDDPPVAHKGKSKPLQVLRHLWNPAPVPKPRIDPHLDELSWPERSGEVIGFTVLSLEHWLSQGGVLREWLRLNLWLAVLFTLFAVLFVPPVTALLEGAAEWSALGGDIVENITTAILRLPPVVLAIATLLLVVKLLQRQWSKRRQGSRHQEESIGGYQ